jgi:hypothetical protein
MPRKKSLAKRFEAERGDWIHLFNPEEGTDVRGFFGERVNGYVRLSLENPTKVSCVGKGRISGFLMDPKYELDCFTNCEVNGYDIMEDDI